jgi:hypothetical protein
MTHEEIRARLMGAMDRSLDPQELDEVERHVADCEACRLEQVELYRMRRSMDREERQREEEADLRVRSRWGPLGMNGLLRVGALALALAVLGIAWHRKRPASPGPPPSLPSARVFPLGPGPVAAGLPGHGRALSGNPALGNGSRVEVPAGSRAVVAMASGSRLALAGPASGTLVDAGSWRPGAGRLLAEAGAIPLRLEIGLAGRLVLTRGRAACEEGAGGLSVALLAGEAIWEGADGARVPLAVGRGLRVSPGILRPEPLPEPEIPWAGALATAFAEMDMVDVVPRVNVVP